jgi:NCS1 family nucleobase:cation symporter-1
MSGYTIILSPICSIMIVDYWFVKKGKIDIPSLYRSEGRYRYTAGFVSVIALRFRLTRSMLA